MRGCGRPPCLCADQVIREQRVDPLRAAAATGLIEAEIGAQRPDAHSHAVNLALLPKPCGFGRLVSTGELPLDRLSFDEPALRPFGRVPPSLLPRIRTLLCIVQWLPPSRPPGPGLSNVWPRRHYVWRCSGTDLRTKVSPEVCRPIRWHGRCPGVVHSVNASVMSWLARQGFQKFRHISTEAVDFTLLISASIPMRRLPAPGSNLKGPQPPLGWQGGGAPAPHHQPQD